MQKKAIRSKKSSAASSQSSGIFNQSHSLIFNFRFSYNAKALPSLSCRPAAPSSRTGKSLREHSKYIPAPLPCPAWAPLHLQTQSQRMGQFMLLSSIDSNRPKGFCAHTQVPKGWGLLVQAFFLL